MLKQRPELQILVHRALCALYRSASTVGVGVAQSV